MESQAMGFNTFKSVKSLVLQFENRKMNALPNCSTNLNSDIGRQRSYSAHEKLFATEKNPVRSISENYLNKQSRTESDRKDLVQTSDSNNEDELEDSAHQKNALAKLDFDIQTELKPKIKSVNSLRKIFEQDANSKRRTPCTKSRSESNLATSCGTKSNDFEALHKSQGDFPTDETVQRKSFVDNEFRQIEDSLKEVEEHIRDMQKHYEIRKNASSIECINIYLTHQDDDEDDDFGHQTLGDHDNIDFVEAFNRLGDELVITTASIERRSICIEDTEFFSGESSSTNRNSLSSEDENLTIIENSAKEDDSLITSNLGERSSIDEFGDNRGVECRNHFVKQHYEEIGDQVLSSEDESISSEEPNEQIINQVKTSESHLLSEDDSLSSEEESQTSSANSEVFNENETIQSNTHPTSLSSERDSVSLPHSDNEENGTINSNSDDEYSTKNAVGEPERAVKAETIYDSNQNPRIEKVTSIDTPQLIKHPPPERSTSEISEALSTSDLKQKKDYIIEELISTERDYLKHLEKVVCHYMPAFRTDKLPVFLRGSKYIFGNIKKIYMKSQKFYRALRKCGTDHDEVARSFIIFEELFELYPLYSKNKPTADYFLIGELRELVLVKEKMLRDRLGLASHLLTPVQRLGKYILLLEQIQKEIVKSGNYPSENVGKAIEIVRKQMSRGNDFIAIDSIKDCPINLAEHAGSFLMREKFYIHKPKKYEAMLFFFENVLVFTTVDAKNSELFFYKDSIPLTEMGVITFEDSPLTFHLRRFSSSKKCYRDYQEYVIEATRSKDKKTWTEEIEKRLWSQLIQCKEQQKALHNKQKNRHSTVEISSRIKTKNASYSSLPGELRNSKRRSIFYDEEED